LRLHQAQPGEFLQRQVDLRGRDVALATERGGIRHSAQYQRHQGFSLVQREPDVFELGRIGKAHAVCIYYLE